MIGKRLLRVNWKIITSQNYTQLGVRIRTKHTNSERTGTHGICKLYSSFPARNRCRIKYYINRSERLRAAENIKNKIPKRLGRDSIRPDQ